MPIRVLRLLEYTYETPERMADDMARWTHSCPPMRGFTMRSAVLTPEWIEPEPKPEPTTCPDCHGSGDIAQAVDLTDAVGCPRCNSSGIVD